MRTTLYALLPLALLVGCTYEEGLPIGEITGTVVLPEEAASRVIHTPNGNEIEVTNDPRLIGPVYLGLFPSVREGIYEYPHPEVGPVFQQGISGDTYPYGGTTVGDFRYPCFEDLVCRVPSGRFVDFDSIVDWFTDTLEQPFQDQYGNNVNNGEYYRQTCYDLMYYTSDEEIRITATEDKNEDGELNELDLDFVQRNDGKWEAEFTFWQQEYFENEETGEGFSLWGWMDAPSESTFRFSTCDPTDGFYETEYNSEFYGGRQYRDLLNRPSQYISTGDYVAGEGYVFQSIDDEPEIELNWLVED